ncbi:MAG TPA: lysophospholipid acyltransferase family protein [Aeromicrobium sp.]|nr:lysophospholipid acyltransferase family protein [Aeromicrobium sp.]
MIPQTPTGSTEPGPELRPTALPERMLERLRRYAGVWLDRNWTIRLHQESNVPAHGPVILAANHIGWLDGPLLFLKSPRPAHSLVKRELYVGKTGRMLKATAQIPVNRTGTDIGALRTAAEALLADQVVTIYPEGRRGAGEYASIKGGVAWLALVTGAPVVPVSIFGTRPAGADKETRPAKGVEIDAVYGEPITFSKVPWPRTTQDIGTATETILNHLREQLAAAKELTGRELPGPLPKAVIHG